jgi:hypothetical protein
LLHDDDQLIKYHPKNGKKKKIKNQKRLVIILKCTTKCSRKQQAFHFFETPRQLWMTNFLRGVVIIMCHPSGYTEKIMPVI